MNTGRITYEYFSMYYRATCSVIISSWWFDCVFYSYVCNVIMGRLNFALVYFTSFPVTMFATQET